MYVWSFSTTALYFTVIVEPDSVLAIKSLKSTVYVTVPSLLATAAALLASIVFASPAIVTVPSTKLSAYKPVEVSITLNCFNLSPSSFDFGAI